MPRSLTEEEREKFLAEPHVAVLSVVSENDRPPLTVPIWYDYRPGGTITFFTGTGGRQARKTRLLEQAGRLSFCVQQPSHPYRYVTVEGTVVGADREPSTEDVAAIVSRYLPEEAAQAVAESETTERTGAFVLFTVRPDRWLSTDFGD